MAHYSSSFSDWGATIGAGIPICANQLEVDFPDEILLARQNTNLKDFPITKNTQINDVIGHLLEIQGIAPRDILTSLSAIKSAVKTKETIEFTFPKK